MRTTAAWEFVFRRIRTLTIRRRRGWGPIKPGLPEPNHLTENPLHEIQLRTSASPSPRRRKVSQQGNTAIMWIWTPGPTQVFKRITPEQGLPWLPLSRGVNRWADSHPPAGCFSTRLIRISASKPIVAPNWPAPTSRCRIASEYCTSHRRYSHPRHPRP